MISSIFVTWNFGVMAEEVENDHEHIDVSSISAEQVYVDKTFGVTVKNAQDVSYYMFIPEEDATYLIYSIGEKYDTAGTLYDGEGNLLIDKNGGGDYDNFLIEADLIKGNTYYIACKMYSAEATGEYDAIVQKFSPSGSGEDIPSEDEGGTPPEVSGDGIVVDQITLSGVIYTEKSRSVRLAETGMTAYYSFVPEVSGIYSLEILKITEETVVKIYDDTGSFIESFSGTEDSLFETKFEGGSIYYFGYSFTNTESTGAFTTRLKLIDEIGGGEDVTTPSEPDIDVNSIEYADLQVGLDTECYLKESDQINYYRILSDDHAIYNFDFFKVAGEINVCVYDAAGYLIDKWNFGSDSSFSYEFKAGDTHYIGVSLISGELPNYLLICLSAKEVSGEAPSTPNHKLYENYANGFTIVPGEKLRFEFCPSSDGTYIFRDTSGSDTVCYLYDENGNLIASNDDSSEGFSFNLSYDLSCNHIYYYEVFLFDSNNEGWLQVWFERYIPIEEIIIHQSEITDHVGMQQSVHVELLPGGNIDSIIWSSSDESVATVTDGIIFFKGVGEATVTAATKEGVSATVKVTSLASSELSLGSTTITKRDEHYIFTPEKDGKYTLYVSGDIYATIEMYTPDYVGGWGQDGYNASLSVELEGGISYGIRIISDLSEEKPSATFTIVEAESPESFKIEEEAVSLKISQSYRLSTIFLPQFSFEEDIFWSSSNSSIVQIENGTLIALSAGTVTVKARTASGFSDTVEVTVTEPDSIPEDVPVDIITNNTEEENEVLLYRFTASSDATHYFKLENPNLDVYLIELIENGSVIMNWNSDVESGSFEWWLTNGRTIYVRIINLSSIGERSAQLTITTKKQLESIRIINNSGSHSFEVGSSIDLSFAHYPSDVACPSVLWSSSDDTIATVDEKGCVIFHSKGYVTIYLRTTDGSGLSDEISFNVSSIENLVLGEDTITVLEQQNVGIWFSFTPSESGLYLFSSSEWSNDPYIRLYDSNKNFIDENDDYNGTWGFGLSCSLTEGCTYYVEVFERCEFGKVLFKVEKLKSVTSVEVSKAPEKAEYYLDYPNQHVNLNGLELLITYEDGNSFTWEYDPREVINEHLYFEYDYTSLFENGTIVFTVGAASVEYTFKMLENPVEKIEVIQSSTTKYYDQTGGYMNYIYYEGEKLEYYHYYLKEHSDAFIRIFFKDGNTEDACLGSYVLGEYIGYSNDLQYQNPWSLGSENPVEVSFFGHTANLYVTVEENPVERIELSGANTIELIFEQNGCWDWRWDHELGQDVEYFRYDYPNLGELVITIYYTNGTQETTTLNKLGNYSTHDFQSITPWTLNGEQQITITYMNRSAYLNVLIIEPPIKSIEVTKAPVIEITYGDLDRGYMSSEGYCIDSISLDGVELTITYTDGNVETVNATDLTFDGFYCHIEYPCNITEPGLHPVIISYLGVPASFDITIKESEVKSIEVTKQPTNGHTDYGFLPSLEGMQLTITLRDGTVKTVDVTESNLTFDIIEMAYVITDSDGNRILAMVHEIYEQTDSQTYLYDFRIVYLGAFATVYVSTPMNSDVSNVEISKVETNDDYSGITLNVTVNTADGKERSYALESIFVVPMESNEYYSSYEVYAYQSLKGCLNYTIVFYYDNGRVSYASVNIFGESSTIDLRDESENVSAGDVDGDGQITNSDVTVLIRALCGWNESNATYCDVNGDGKVNNRDAISLIQMVNEPKHEEIIDPTPLPDGYVSLA